MTTDDVPAASSVAADVGWPGRERRFEFYVRHPLCEAAAAEVEGRGRRHRVRDGERDRRWIGMVCVKPRYQGHDVGRALTERVARRLEGRGWRTLVLTATQAGRPFYEKMGFAAETFYHGFSGPGSPPNRRLRAYAGCVPKICPPSATSTAA